MPDLLAVLAFGSAVTTAAVVVCLIALAYLGWMGRLTVQARGGR